MGKGTKPCNDFIHRIDLKHQNPRNVAVCTCVASGELFSNIRMLKLKGNICKLFNMCAVRPGPYFNKME